MIIAPAPEKFLDSRNFAILAQDLTDRIAAFEKENEELKRSQADNTILIAMNIASITACKNVLKDLDVRALSSDRDLTPRRKYRAGRPRFRNGG